MSPKALWLCLLVAAPCPVLAQSHPAPLRNTFVVATESVLDDLASVDIASDPGNYEAAMKSAQAARTNLKQMATEEGEPEVVAAVDNVFFAVSACHIQAVDGTDTTRCKAQIDRARNHAMDVLGKHKQGPAWVDGPPA